LSFIGEGEMFFGFLEGVNGVVGPFGVGALKVAETAAQLMGFKKILSSQPTYPSAETLTVISFFLKDSTGSKEVSISTGMKLKGK